MWQNSNISAAGKVYGLRLILLAITNIQNKEGRAHIHNDTLGLPGYGCVLSC